MSGQLELLELQLAQLWRMADGLGERDRVTDSVKRHHRIRLQQPETGRLALSIANLEAAIDANRDAALVEHLSDEEFNTAARAFERAASQEKRDGDSDQAGEDADAGGVDAAAGAADRGADHADRSGGAVH
jgi:hypothetical protein